MDPVGFAVSSTPDLSSSTVTITIITGSDLGVLELHSNNTTDTTAIFFGRGSEGQAEDDEFSAADLEKWMVIKKRAGHKSRRPPCKAHADSRDVLTPEEMVQLRQEFVEELANPALAKERKVAKAKARHHAGWKPPEAPQSQEEYRFDFGKHSGSTLRSVLQEDPGYLDRLMSWRNNILDQKLTLRCALEKEGLLEGLLAKRPQLMVERARGMIAKAAEDKDKPLHPEIAKLRVAQHIEATEILAMHSSETAVAALAAPPRDQQQKRKRVSAARYLLPHCSRCGSVEHKRPQCPNKSLQGEVVEDCRSQAVVDYMRNRRSAALVARLKYTQISIRTRGYEERAKKMARAPIDTDFVQMARWSPEEFVHYLVSAGILHDLKGTPCPRGKCQSSKKSSFLEGAEKELGQLRCNAEKGQDIIIETAWHACGVCRVRQSVALHNPLFSGLLGKGSKGVSMCVMAWWLAAEGVPESVAVRQLNIHEGVVQGERGDACRPARARWIQWGTGSSRTVEVEVDATVICKWKAEENAELTHSYYCYIGIRQRGSTSHFAMMPLGGRVAPESSEAYHAFCKEILGDRKYNLLLMTDGAGCYKCRCSDCVVRFEEHHSVNHSRKPKAEFSRPIPAVVADVDTGHTRGSMAGTMTIDKEWDLLKEPLPRNLTARAVEDVDRTDGYVRHPHAIATGMPTAAAPSIVTAWHAGALWGDRYLERQGSAPVCGRHALNNLLGAPQFSDGDLEAWWRILKHNDRVWHVDSLREPAILDEAAFGRALRRHPMAFPIVTNSYQE
ncbi:unnamed protein product [Prorocentrum cordatum]|uniref:Ubiquitinyl hydrolase 1 n=1 Tax=Prorocentrum cordatum TaxID=2364126 RepID=A0ABN9T120_9DINO|nr:unnamed protein product [Polarella glacialis]